MKTERLIGSLHGYWRAHKDNLASYAETEKGAIQLLTELIGRKK